MRRIRRAGARAVPLLAALALVAGCAPWGLGTTRSSSGAVADGDYLPYDLEPLVRPGPDKYLGAAGDGVPTSTVPLDAYARMTGKRPNLVEEYASWGDSFDASGVRKAWAHGALTLVSWEPRGTTMEEIAAGRSDAYVRKFARAVRRLNLPVVLDFADEMNGFWETWGPKHATAAQYVAAYRHVHDVFTDLGVANVIWTWAPNIVNPAPNVALTPYYPGDGYVDWMGMIGYFTRDEDTFDAVFGRTLEELRALSDKPVLIVETAAEQTARRTVDVRELFAGVSGDDGIVGFVWFNHDKRADWRLEAGSVASRAEFRRLASGTRYGFDVRERAGARP
ncbi:beta-mannanase [Streptomyces sp. WAC02707]|uniref:glycoside hydrolase family 26 protein n=1 Tax=Streptomyces sp. WAC02707 TaxID=2487417 RepID=UPI000F782113|nr:glycosyl hydrolase [Streptomyces sp. WAC02707]RSS84429.1 beta-mannanase [Streptomyces sp. WAC02707]